MDTLKLFLLVALELTPFVLRLYQGRIDYVAIILAGQFVGYSLPLATFGFRKGFSAVLTPEVARQTNALLLCTLLILTGFYGARRCLRSKSPLTHRYLLLEISFLNLGLISVALLLSFLVSRSIPKDSTNLFLNTQFILTVFIFAVIVPGRSWELRLIKIGVLLGSLYSFLIFANLGFLINLLVIWLAIAFLYRTIYPWLRVAFLLVPLCLLQSIKGEYRALIAANPDLDTIERAGAVVTLLEHKAESLHPPAAPTFVAPREDARKTLDRVRDASLQTVLEQTPERVPYWRGRSYLNLLYLLVPDSLWPGKKPDWNVANEWGHVYGFLTPDDRTTEVVFSYLAEAYMNFGYLFLLAMALVSGVLFAAVERLSSLDLHGIYLFTFICFLMPLLSYQSDLSSMLVKLIITALVLGVGPHRLLRARGKTNPVSEGLPK